jgi:hypothetical protein
VPSDPVDPADPAPTDVLTDAPVPTTTRVVIPPRPVVRQREMNERFFFV